MAQRQGKVATVDLTGRQAGNLWQYKPSASSKDGLLVHLLHRYNTTTTTLYGRPIRFTRVAFNDVGDRLAAADQQGNVFVICLHRNRFSLLRRLGSPCTALSFVARGRPDILVGLADITMRCLNNETGEQLASLRGHTASVRHLSVHVAGRYILSTSSAESILWESKTYQRLRTLTGAQDVGVQEALFLPLSNTIVTCFKDDSIFAWEADTLEYKFRLNIHDGPSPRFRALVASPDGRFLVAGGRSRFLHVWAVDTRHIVRVIELPDGVRHVVQLFFINDNCQGGASQTLGVGCQDGIIRFLNVHSCRLLFELGTSNGHPLDRALPSQPVVEPVSFAVPSTDGRQVAAVVDSGAVQVFSVEDVCPQLFQPPAPLVKAVSPAKGAEQLFCLDGTPRPTKRKRRAPFPTKPLLHESTSPTTASRTHSEEGSITTFSSSDQRRASQIGLDSLSIDSDGENLPVRVDISKLTAILRGYGRFPEKYRLFIWRSLLRLPENHAAFAALTERGTHPAYQMVHEKYPVKSRKLLRQLQRTLSALAYWSPIFAEVSFLPPLVFPFVKLFSNNRLLAFEVCASLLLNWCQHWFDFHPHVPVGILGTVESVLAHHDVGLLRHLTKCKITSAVYAWPLFENFFSEVLTREEWLSLMDNVLSNPPHYLLFVAVAYCMHNRQALMRCHQQQDFIFFFHHRNAVNLPAIIKEAYRLDETTPNDIHPCNDFKPFEPLTRGQYPVFSSYPKFVVDYQRQERDHIRQEELGLLRERQATLAQHQARLERHREEETFQRHQQILNEAEEHRRALLAEEEEKLHEQRLRLLALKRELQSREMTLLDAARRRFMQRQIEQREADLRLLDEDLERKAKLREQETQVAVEAAEVQATELETQKAMLEQNLARHHQAARSQYKHAWRDEMTSGPLTGSPLQCALMEDMQQQRQELQRAQERLARVQQANENQRTHDEVMFRSRLNRLEKELQQLQVTHQELDVRARVDELSTLMHNVEASSEPLLRTPQHTVQLGEQTGSPMHDRQLRNPASSPDMSVSSLLSGEQGSECSQHRHLDSARSQRETLDLREAELLSQVANLRSRVAQNLRNPHSIASLS